MRVVRLDVIRENEVSVPRFPRIQEAFAGPDPANAPLACVIPHSANQNSVSCAQQRGELMPEADEAYEKILVANLGRVIDFLKFAEAKNGGLLALSSAWLLASINLECGGHALPGALRSTVPLTFVLTLCAALLAAWSFSPKLHLPRYLGGKKAGPHPKNLLYFGDIASVTPKMLEENIRSRYYSEKAKFRDEYLHDLTVQISVISSIVLRKMRLFAGGVLLVIAAAIALLAPALALAYHAIKEAL